MERVVWLALVAIACASPAQAQERASDVGPRLVADPRVQAALAAAQKNEPELLNQQVEICEVPAPPFQEQARAEVLKRAFTRLGLKNVRIDKAGNVLGERPGSSPRPHLVFSAHLDTVFPEGTDVKVGREKNVMRGPGIGDDCRGLAVVLGVLRALDDAKVTTAGSITFVATVGEEGLGDLRGVKYLFNEELKGRIDRFVSVDGTGLGMTHIAVGSYRYRTTFKGPGGHSYGAFGLPSPIHALGRAIALISELRVPAFPRTTFNVGRIGGGTSVNAIAYDAWFEIDMRSADPAALQKLDKEFRAVVDQALAAENARWGGGPVLTVEHELVGDRPAGRTPEDAPIVRAAVSVTRALGFGISLDEGSTDANVPISLKIPAITIDGGGRGTGGHALNETFDATDSWKGTQRALLLAIALAEP